MSNAGRKATIAITGILIGTTLIGGSLIGQEMLARKLEPQAVTALADAGFTNIDVSFKGREAYLTGHGKTDVEMERARVLVENINGVRWAKVSNDNGTSADPTQTTSGEENALEPTVSVQQAANGIILTGTVATQEEADAMVVGAERVFGSPVDNQLVVNPEADDQPWVTDLTYALGATPPISGGTLEANSQSITITGEVATDDDAALVDSAMGTISIPVTNGITVSSGEAPVATDLTDAELAQVNNTSVSFAMKAYELDNTAKQQLDSIVPLLLKTDKTLTVRGYLSDPHKPENQDRDSKARAQSVADYLISKGVPASRIIVEGRGVADPIASNNTAEGRAANQRATLALS